MKALLADNRVQRLLVANTLGSIGSGITIFAVPWLMVKAPDGNAAYRWITIATTIVLFAIMPSYGAWVDGHSRKSALLASEAWGFFATLSMAVVGLLLGHFATWQLMAVYFAGMLYYTLHYPAKFAFVQQIFDRTHYQSLMGLLEIQGQSAMMIAGGLGSMLVDHVPLWAILLFDASTYAISFVLISSISYRSTHLETAADAAPVPPTSTWKKVADGWNWLAERPQLNLFLICSFMPFIVVMVSNYLFPIFVSQTLHVGPIFFGLGEITFAGGAMLAGALLPRWLSRHQATLTIPGTMLCFLAGLLVIILFRHPYFYLAAGALLGFGNAGSRVARNTLMLHAVPNAMMGRIGIFYAVFDRFWRTVLVGAMVIIDTRGPPVGFMLLAVITALALAGAYASRNAARQSEAHALAAT
jgi:MFS family permease